MVTLHVHNVFASKCSPPTCGGDTTQRYTILLLPSSTKGLNDCLECVGCFDCHSPELITMANRDNPGKDLRDMWSLRLPVTVLQQFRLSGSFGRFTSRTQGSKIFH